MEPLIVAENLRKAYGPTVAVNSVSLSIRHTAITALLGGNGAGKSSLIRLLSGAAEPDEGKLLIDSREIRFAEFSVPKAKEMGIRVVHQELSVCTNLNVAENFFLELSQLVGKASSWRRTAGKLAEDTLATIFPGNRIRATSNVGSLSIAEQQMVEIARAAADRDLKVFILDEPTSSIDATGAHQLMEYLRRRAKEGLCVVFIGHKLGEILDLAEDFLVMRDGRLVWSGKRAQTDHESLVALLSAQTPVSETETSKGQPHLDKIAQYLVPSTRSSLVEISNRWRENADDGPIKLFGGEIVGLAGLEGGGQQSLLVGIYDASGRGKDGVSRTSKVAYVAGDRRKEGVFPLWATMQNMTVSRHARRGKLKPVSNQEEKLWTEPWRKRFNLSDIAAERPILQLSGGNQQKALMSRAMIDEADIILLNDPTRGVDIGVKREFYHVLMDVAAAGKLIVWYSSEDAEFLECSRVLVFRRGSIATEISGQDATRENLSAAFFAASETKRGVRHTAQRHREAKSLPGWLVPLAVLVVMLAAIGIFNPKALSPFGLGLLLGTAVPLVLVAYGQMFVVGRSEIDLGIGAFAGLSNVISATLLVEKPVLGVAALTAGLAGYGLLGWVIHVRRIPALVATLGSAFVWTGLGYVLQPAPGGSSPEWLAAIFNLSIPILPLPIWILLITSTVAVLLTRSRLGIVQRGFGNNEPAMRSLGWPAARSHVATYLLGGIFGLAAGLCLTGVNTASDINAASSYTLLSIAAVVMAGCDLVGGRIEPVGVLFAAVTLSLLGTLLGFMRLSSDIIAAVQGFILIGIVVSRTIWIEASMKILLQKPWIWALFGIFVLWILLSIGAGQVNLGNLTGILAAAALLCVVAIGQTLVVTTGNGAVDLSIPSVMTLSGFVATSVTNGQDARLPLGILAIAALGIGVGWINALIVNRLRIPPIIATLAVGYILITATLIYNRGFTTYAVSPLLAYVASGRVVGVPIILLLAIALTAAASWFMHRTVYGRQLSAVGQNSRAAYFAGIKVEQTTRIAYVLSGLLAAFGGLLLSGRVSGAFLEMGTPFLLQSVGAVVVGGSSIVGGMGTPLGTLLGSIFLAMIVTTMAVLRVPGGFQDMIQGILIILVLAVAAAPKVNPSILSAKQPAK